MSSTEENVAVLGSNHHETEPAPMTTTTAPTAPTTTATTDSHTENVNADNQLDVPPTSSSLEPVAPDAASKTMGEEPRSEFGAHTENQHQEGETLENEHPLNSTEESSTATPTPAAATPAAESTGDDIPVATVIATPSAAAASTSSQPKPKNPDATDISAADGEASHKPQIAKEVVAATAAPVAAAAAVEDEEETGPGLTITLLLITGARHPFKIDRKYLKRRSIKVENDDPFKMSVYTLKELIWREWRSEWEPQPSSPSAIRLISFGKLLDDKSPLSESSLTYDAPNVIHMTVKPQEAVDEEDAKGGKSYSGRDREATDRSPGCRCIIL